MQSKSITRVIASGSLWMFISSVGIKMVGVAYIFLVLKRLSVYEYGLSELIVATGGLLELLTLSGTFETLVSDISQEKSSGNIAKAKKIFQSYFNIQIATCILAFVLLFFGSFIFTSYLPAESLVAFRIYALTYLITPIRSLFNILNIVNLDFKLNSVFSFIEELAKLLIVLPLFYYADMRLNAIFIASTLSTLVTSLFFITTLYGRYRDYFTNWQLDFKTFGNIIRSHGKWGILSNYTNGLGQKIRLFTIQRFLGTESVGVFSFAYSLLTHTISLLSISKIITPIYTASKSDPKRLGAIFTKAVKYQTFIFIILATGGLFVIGPVISYIFPKYTGSLYYYYILLIAVIPQSIAVLITPLFYAFKNQKNLFYAINIKNLFILFLSPALVFATGGIIGAIAEFIIALSLYTLGRLLYIRRRYPELKINFRQLLTFTKEDRLFIKNLITKRKL